MKKPTDKEVMKALNDAVKFECLVKENNKYKFHPSFYGKALNFKSKKKHPSKEEVYLDVLYRSGYFKKARTEREIFVIITILSL